MLFKHRIGRSYLTKGLLLIAGKQLLWYNVREKQSENERNSYGKHVIALDLGFAL